MSSSRSVACGYMGVSNNSRALITRTPLGEAPRSDRPIPKGPKYPKMGYVGFLYQES